MDEYVINSIVSVELPGFAPPLLPIYENCLVLLLIFDAPSNNVLSKSPKSMASPAVEIVT